MNKTQNEIEAEHIEAEHIEAEHIEAEPFIMMDDCCMKSTIKKFVKFLKHKPLTNDQALMIYVYHFLFSITLNLSIIQYRFVSRWLEWANPGLLSSLMITHIAIFVNILILIEMIENIKEMIHTVSCKCDYRQHPELDS
jgi:hypothetical protein